MHNVRFDNSDSVPVQESAIYLGSNLAANGNQPAGIKNLISVTLITLKQLKSFWTKSPASVKWEFECTM
eukprot:6606215-Heterocapsa_arctica.AAC.1